MSVVVPSSSTRSCYLPSAFKIYFSSESSAGCYPGFITASCTQAPDWEVRQYWIDQLQELASDNTPRQLVAALITKYGLALECIPLIGKSNVLQKPKSDV